MQPLARAYKAASNNATRVKGVMIHTTSNTITSSHVNRILAA
jgi:hypothetical protein